MSGPLRRPGPGDPLPRDVETWRAIYEAARQARDGGGLGAGVGGGGGPASLEVFVRNDTGADLDQFAVVALGEPIISAVDAPEECQRTPCFPGTEPAAATDPFAVLIEPIADGETGRAVLLGVAVVDLDVTDAGHGYAAPAAGETATLASAESGPAKIIWKESGTGTKRAVVLLQGDMGAAASTSAWKPPVRARTVAALASNTYSNGSSGVGATLTGNSNGALTAQDGVTLTVNQDLLVANEVTASHNGIYTLTQVGTAGTPYILTRRADADEPTDLLEAVVAVEEGTLHADTVWLCTANATITVGTTSLPWIKLAISPLTTKGDVWGYSTTDARIPVGSNGQVLTADSTQALGVKWDTPVAGITSPLTTKGDIWGYSTLDARVPVGSNGQLLAADSTQALGVKWISEAYDQETASGSTSLTTDDAYSDIVSISLPSAGTYELTAVLGCNGQVSALAAGTPVSGHILGQLYDSTNSAVLVAKHTSGGALTAEWVALAIQVVNVAIRSAHAFTCQVTVAGAVTVKLRAARQGGPTWSFATILATSPEPAWLAYRKMFI